MKTNNKIKNNMFCLVSIMVSIKCVMLFCMLCSFSLWGGESKSGDILVHLRLYEGSRGNEAEASSVVSSYYLTPLFISSLVSETDIREEKSELQRIFNLSDIKLMTLTQLAWKEGEKRDQFSMMILNGHEFQVRLTRKSKADTFGVEVGDKGKKGAPLLETEVVLPERKSTVFGFEDSLRKPFFICLQREGNRSVIGEEPLRIPTDRSPRLVKRVNPKYPKDAVKKRIEGKVVLDAVTDKRGNVTGVYVVEGVPELNDAAVDAIKQWKYEPYMIDGKPRAVRFTVIVRFNLSKKDRKMPFHQGTAGASSLVPGILPVRGYLRDGFGTRRDVGTGKEVFHNGLDIATKMGSPVIASADGTVMVVETRKGYGKMIIIDHGNGYTTRYGELSAFKVKKGQKVKRGDEIALVGNSGSNVEPHLHYEVRLNGVPLNPLTLLQKK